MARAPSRRPAASSLSVDLTFAFDRALGAGKGLPFARWAGLEAQASPLVAAFPLEVSAGCPAYVRLPFRDELVEPVLAWAKKMCPSTTDVLLVWIGGSSRTALRSSSRPR